MILDILHRLSLALTIIYKSYCMRNFIYPLIRIFSLFDKFQDNDIDTGRDQRKT